MREARIRNVALSSPRSIAKPADTLPVWLDHYLMLAQPVKSPLIFRVNDFFRVRGINAKAKGTIKGNHHSAFACAAQEQWFWETAG